MSEHDISWCVQTLRNPGIPKFIWKLASSITVSTVGCLSKLFIKWLNKTQVYNAHELLKLVEERPANVPLITISNHHSCFDDPGLWVMLPWRCLLFGHRRRWSLAAHDICFTNKYTSYFFMLGKCIPIIRGNGIWQEAIDFCISLLNRGSWLHVFPEGRVNMTKEFLRLKWGVGRMIYEATETPIVLPIFHLGMEEVLPNYPPYYLRVGKKVTMNVGRPLDLRDLVERLRREKVSDECARKTITDYLQTELYRLKEETEELHRLRGDFPVGAMPASTGSQDRDVFSVLVTILGAAFIYTCNLPVWTLFYLTGQLYSEPENTSDASVNMRRTSVHAPQPVLAKHVSYTY